MSKCAKCHNDFEPETNIVQFVSMAIDDSYEVKEGSEDYLELLCMDCYESIIKSFI
jgi:hypothetical protein